MKVEYNELSFWAGVSVGANLHGKSAFGVMPGWNPDGDLILRPITQGIGRVYFNQKNPVTVGAFIGTVDEDTVFPIHEVEGILQNFARIAIGKTSVTIAPINERLVLDETIKAFSVDENINPLEYDDTIVFINSSGAFTMDEMTRTFTSTKQTVDIGTMQEVTVTVNEFAEVATQEVTT